jgi:hypothetical protein
LEDFGSGVYLKDTISLQGVTTENVSFGYVTSYGNQDALLVPAATIAGRSWQNPTLGLYYLKNTPSD